MFQFHTLQTNIFYFAISQLLPHALQLKRRKKQREREWRTKITFILEKLRRKIDNFM